jgi:predicted glycosyltransferase
MRARCDDSGSDRREARCDVPGLLFYSHDTYGLGHFRRTLALASFLRARTPLSQLIVTGSPLAHRFPMPPDTDFVKLPSVVKVGAGQYASRSLSLPFRRVRALRRDLVLDAARHFRPRVLIVDNVPGGLKGELIPTLHYLKSTSCRLVLGLRDVVDEADWVREAWAKDGSYELLDDVYDRILVYGERDIYDPVAAYGFSPAAAEKTRFVGYLGRERGRRDPDEVRASLDVDGKKLVLVMAGGGEDGYELLHSVLAALRLNGNRKRFACLLLGGPLMPSDHRLEVRELAKKSSVRYLDFVDDVASYVQAADVVVSMGGYNSVCELLSLGKPALVVPRVRPRREQLIRARALSRRGLLRMIEPAALGPERLLEEMKSLLDEPPQVPNLPMTGLARAADAVHEQLSDAQEEHWALAAGARHG